MYPSYRCQGPLFFDGLCTVCLETIHNLLMETVLGILTKSWLQFSVLILQFSYCITLWHHLLATRDKNKWPRRLVKDDGGQVCCQAVIGINNCSSVQPLVDVEWQASIEKNQLGCILQLYMQAQVIVELLYTHPSNSLWNYHILNDRLPLVYI